MIKIILNTWIFLVLSFLTLVPCANCETEAIKSDQPLTNQQILAEFTFKRDEVVIFIPVRIKGKEYLFFLDTGASTTAFDSSLKEDSIQPRRTGGALFTAGAPATIESFNAPDAFFGPFNLKECGEIIYMDLKMLSSIHGKEISGILGMNFLKKYVVQINFDGGKLLFLKPMAGKNPDWGEAHKIDYHPSGLPFITGTMLKNIKVDFVIDIGDGSTGALHRMIFEKIISENQIRTSEALSQTAGGMIRPRVARIESLSIGTFRYKNLIFDEGNFSRLGLSLLSRHLVTFDFPNNKIYLKKGKKFNKKDELDMTGLHLLRISNQTVVHSVDKDSPADKVGIQAGDVIFEVNGKNANEYQMWELGQIKQSGDKQKMTIVIKRENDIKKVSFFLKKKI